ncbi:MAG: hypothetical protein WA709_02190 [Stellaceae bacterium]
MEPNETLEMAYPRKYVENIIIGLEDPLNEHLVKLVGFDFSVEQRNHFRREVRTWLGKIQRLRMKPDSRTGSVKFYFDLLFDYPFGGVEVQNMRTMLDVIGEEYGVRPTKSPQELVEWLRRFHQVLADRFHNGQAVLDLVPE